MAIAARQQRPNNLVFLNRDRGYRFSDRDPDLEELCDLIHKSQMTTKQISDEVQKATGGYYRISPGTINNWLSGKTRHPLNVTMKWVTFAIGYERRYFKC